MIARLLDFDNLSGAIYIQEPPYGMEARGPLLDFRLYLLVRKALHTTGIEDDVPGLVHGLTKAPLDGAQVVGLRRFHLPEDAPGDEVSRFGSVSLDARPEFDIHTKVSYGACGGHLVQLNVEIGRRDYVSLVLRHGGHYTRVRLFAWQISMPVLQLFYFR